MAVSQSQVSDWLTSWLPEGRLPRRVPWGYARVGAGPSQGTGWQAIAGSSDGTQNQDVR